MRPGEVIPFVRHEDLLEAKKIEKSLLAWSGGADWLMFAAVSADPRDLQDPAHYRAFVGSTLGLSKRETHDVVEKFLEDVYPDLQITLQVRRGSVR